jgi:diguanylate cyclase (GGDEF)-like protein
VIVVPPTSNGRADELLFQSQRSRVFRQFLPSGSIIRKQALEPGAAARVRHETAMLERLSSIAGIAKLSASGAAVDSIALQDDRGLPLAALLRSERLEIPLLLDLALDLSRTIASMHRLGVVHRDINPSNILLVGPKRRPVLIDFGIASSSAEERPAFTTRAEIEGTLAYIAPEQTGRTGRVMDQRADLYALGATFYELATGGTPFDSRDSFQVICDHLLRLPAPPIDRNADLPQAFSDITMRLLEKEPDRRYQSAEGLAADLTSLIERRASGDFSSFRLGECDFPQRLLPPSRLIGRETEIVALRAAFEGAMHGGPGALFVSGVAGIGKTQLINELRSIVTTRGGLFVAGKFDYYRQDLDSDGIRRAFRDLFRLLLAEPEEELAPLRARLLHELGAGAALSAAVIPELGVLLGFNEAVASDDLVGAEARIRQNAFATLKCIASPARPIVFTVDDLQWAPAAALNFVDTVISNPGVPGLLFVGAYRPAEVNAAHALSAMLARWKRSSVPPRELFLSNLGQGDLGKLLQEMLRLPPAQAERLAEAVASRTGGNPYDSVELINALRRDGILTPGAGGWSWDEPGVRRYVGHGDVVSMLGARIDALPARCRELLKVMVCLGGDVQCTLLQAAAGVSAAALDDRLTPALEDGLVVFEQSAETSIRFRHDRIQQAAYGRLDPQEALETHLFLARRLAEFRHRENIAAEQYLAAAALIRDPAECRNVIAFFRGAAAQARMIGNFHAMERFVRAAASLLVRAELDDCTLETTLEKELHVALYSLGRLEEADAVYRSLAQRGAEEPLETVEATCVQISSLTNRNQPRAALTLGLDLLARLELRVPDTDSFGAPVESRLDEIYRWCDIDHSQMNLPRAQSEERVVAAGKLLGRMMPPAFFCDGTILAWLVLESMRLWSEHGPRASLVGPISHTVHVTIALRNDYRIGYRVARRILAISEGRNYEPETSLSRFLFSLASQHWFEPLEDSVEQAHAAHRGLVQGGDLQNACFTYYASIPLLFALSRTVDEFSIEVAAGLAFSARTGNDQAGNSFLACRQLVKALRGETISEGSFTDGSFDEDTHLAALGQSVMGTFYFHVFRATSALLFGQAASLLRHVNSVMPLVPLMAGTPVTAMAYVLHALALAQRLRATAALERSAGLAELDRSRDWVKQRASEAPDNFLYALRLIEGERAWAVGDFATGSVAFEAALIEAQLQRSPQHEALVAERAGLFYLEHGLKRYGRLLLLDAFRLYERWGATGKARRLEAEHPFMLGGDAPSTAGSTTRAILSSESIDSIGILRASQALSSETSLSSLEARVGEVLAALTGASSVLLVVRSDDIDDWLVSAGAKATTPLSVKDAADAGMLPLSAFRYVLRTLEPLLVGDATGDDRFGRDPYFAAVAQCSLLVVPILSQGRARAVLMLENQLGRDAFSASRLDAVMLIAGQLAVSLENATLYASLERKVTERTNALAVANRKLALLSLTDALTGLVNRRGFDDGLEGAWRRALRSKSSVGLAMIDIDDFKKYNDRYGHGAGDACLQRVAKTLTDGIHPGSDTAARYGGEEFVLILPGTDLQGSCSTAERLRQAVAALQEPHADSLHGIVTVSAGVVAFVPTLDQHAATYLAAADAALYAAKRNGRNRVERAVIN